MPGSWADSVTKNASRHRSYFRPTRPSYIPPHLRNRAVPMADNSPTPSSYENSNSNSFDGGYPNSFEGGYPLKRSGSRELGRRGRGGRRDRRRPPHVQNPFDVADRFSEMGISEEDGVDGGINFDAYDDIPVDVSGTDVPPSVNTFAEIDLGDSLNQNIRRCKYVKPTPVQRHAIPISLAGRDVMACAQTGSGKTAAFCFPIICGVMKNQLGKQRPQRGGRTAYPVALILSPTRELSCQIHEEAKKFSYQTGVKVGVAYGGAPVHHQLRELERGVDILVATPGRLVDFTERGMVSLQMIKYLALDEADRMLDMGFEPQIRKIVEQMDMPKPGIRQTMLFSATFPNEIQRLASDFLSNYIFLSVGRVGSSTDLIAQRVEFVQEMDKRNHLMNLLLTQRANGTKGKVLTLVFVETKRGADSLENWLCRNGFAATAIHGDRTQLERERALRSFKSGATPIMVATDVASRGLDIPHVAHVVNFDLPRDIDDYVHRIGRTGRAGKTGLATAFFNDGNQPLAKALAELMQEANQEVPSWLSQYAEMSSYGGGSRRRSGGSRFGGYDYRRSDASYRRGNDFYDSYGSESGGYVGSGGNGINNTGTIYPSSNVQASYAYGVESVVASGWD